MRLCRVVAFLILFLGFQSIRTYGQVVATWTDSSSNWSNAANWSTNPVVPNNGGGTTYSVTIGTSNSVVSMDVLNDTIDNLTLGATNSLNIGAGNSLTLISGASSSSGTLNNAGTLYNQFGGEVFFGGRPAAILNNLIGGTITNAGGFHMSRDSTLVNYGALTNQSGGNLTLSLGGGLANSATLTNAGNFTIRDGFLNNSFGAYLNNSSEGTITNSFFDGTITNSGLLINAGTLINIGTLNNNGTLDNNGNFTNSGAVAISGSGLLTTSTNYTQTAGSTLVNGTLTATGSAIVNIQGGIFGGSGTINANVMMGGALMPEPGDSPGTLTIFGNYEQTGTGIFDELMSPLSHSFLDVNGNVVLDPGSLLEISLLDGFNPLGQTFDIMDYNNLVGEFANGSSFSDDGYIWDVTYGQNQIDVTAVRVPEPGTFSLLGGAVLIWLLLYTCCNWACLLRRKRPGSV
jgi:hypothetical protein